MSDSSSAIQSVLVENRAFPRPEALVKAARISPGIGRATKPQCRGEQGFRGLARPARENIN